MRPLYEDPVDISRTMQRAILASYVCFLLLCVPLWWHLSSIDRQQLPDLSFPLTVISGRKEIRLPLTLRWNGPPLFLTAVQNRLATTINNLSVPIRSKGSASTADYFLRPIVTMHGLDIGVKHQQTIFAPLVSVVEDVASNGTAVASVATDGAITIHGAKTADHAARALCGFLEQYFGLMPDFPDTAKFAPRFEVLFSLLVQDPTSYPSLAAWPINGVMTRYVTPFLNHLLGSNTAEPWARDPEALWFASSQVEYYAQPGAGLESALTAAARANQQRRVLPFFRNSEWNLPTLTRDTSTIHVVFYLLSKSAASNKDLLTALRKEAGDIDDDKSTDIVANFIVPRWGGILVLSPPQSNSSSDSTSSGSPPSVIFDEQRLAEISIGHLRELFGVVSLISKRGAEVNTEGDLVDVVSYEKSQHGISAFEVQLYRTQRTVLNVLQTADTLAALQRLTTAQDNLPVSQKICNLAAEALRLATKAIEFGPNSWEFSHAARVSSDAAFFDHNMVGMLYFPYDHKFAIYMPFFLPLLLGLLRTVFWEYRTSRKEWAAALKKEKEQ